jgi:formamidopyrimidine-DNA glycosylase
VPEGLEAEIWRRALESLVGRTITDVWIDDRVADPGIPVVLPGSTVERIERHGKIIRVHTPDHVLGLHFGMTGRVIVDGVAPIESLEYASNKDRPAWDRLRLSTAGGTGCDALALRVNDPRRLGRSSLDADLDHLGVDIFRVDRQVLASALAGRRAAIKTVLLDQGAVAGLGNLCADEMLWWSGVAPHRRVDSLTEAEVGSIASAIATRLPIMLNSGGSTAGELDPAMRHALGSCPRDRAPLQRSTIAGRTAVWCPHHQH